MKEAVFKFIKNNRKHTSSLLLVLAIVVAFVTRYWKLTKLPFPPDGDELAFGYYGWSLLKFGTDEYGNFLPFSFLSIGDFKYPGLAYLNIIPALIFGLSEFTSRFWSAFSGVILVPITYLLTDLLLSKKKVAVISAWLIAISPWSILESRLGYENHLSMTIVVFSFVLLLISLRKDVYRIGRLKIDPLKHGKILTILSFSLLSLSLFVYAAQRVFIPLMLVGLLVIAFDKRSGIQKSRKRLVLMLIFLISIVVLSLVPKTSRGRAAEESWKGMTYEQKDRQSRLHVQAGISPTRVPVLFTRVMQNKYRVALYDLAKNYTDHFSPDFLFFSGEASKEKIPDMGLLLFVELILLPVGLVTMLRRNIDYKRVFIFFWLIVAPVASSLTFGGAHIHRSSNMIPAIAVFSAYGLYVLTTMFNNRLNRLLLAGLLVVLTWSSLYALNQLFVQKPVDNPWRKEQVFEEVVKKTLDYSTKYKAVVLEDNDYIHFLFYGKISPSIFKEDSEIEEYSFANRWERVNSFRNIHFKMPFNCPKSGKLGVIYACSGGNIPQNSIVLDTIYYLDGVPAYNFIEFYPLSDMRTPLPELSKDLYYMVDVESKKDFPDGIIPDDYGSYW